MRKNKKLFLTLFFCVFLIAALIFLYLSFFGAPQKTAETVRFVVTTTATQSEIIQKLKTDGFIKHIGAFNIIVPDSIAPGGYKLQKDMNAFAVADVLKSDPYMKWVIIPEGLRKEEIATLMQKSLGWSDVQVTTFLTKDTNTAPDMREGVYFPDTYLIPVDESTADVAKRLNRRFNEVFAPYAKEALEQNITWPTVITIASLIQREAAGKHDMPLIAGVIWNRLEINMRLDIDATIQYARGDTGLGWWAPLTFAKNSLESPYNTYIHKGLPPGPIANPGLEAIRAVLHPQKTDCFYYLHAKSGAIYCSKTYDEHKEKIKLYLQK